MADTAIARLFTHGRSQAVRLPKEFRLLGDRVRVRHAGNGVMLEPIASDIDAWFAELDRFADVPILDDGRHQPPVPHGEDLLIAGQALRRGPRVVTENTSEFGRIPGLDWSDRDR